MFLLCPFPTPRVLFFFFNDTATTEIYTLSLHDALPISCAYGWLAICTFGRPLALLELPRVRRQRASRPRLAPRRPVSDPTPRSAVSPRESPGGRVGAHPRTRGRDRAAPGRASDHALAAS